MTFSRVSDNEFFYKKTKHPRKQIINPPMTRKRSSEKTHHWYNQDGVQHIGYRIQISYKILNDYLCLCSKDNGKYL